MTVQGEMFEAGHLGGYRVGGDEATFYPDLWTWLATEGLVRSVLDIGCGDGQALAFFRELGCKVRGIDGVEQQDPDIIRHDYTQGPFIPSIEYDLAWSCEFVEHVAEQYMPNFLATFLGARLVLITHASPGQGGYHHVNCRTADYWVGAMAAIGYALDQAMTVRARELAAYNHSPWNHFVRSGLAFRPAQQS